MLDRDSRLKSRKGVPTEEKRLQVIEEEIAMCFKRLAEAIDGVPAHFVDNMDEIGHQEWADRQEKVCHVTTPYGKLHVDFPVPRAGKCIPLIGCIGADGSFVKPLIVLPRKPYDNDLALTGFTHEKVAVYSQSKGRTDPPTFLAWLCDLFIPELSRRRAAFGYTGMVVLIMDNCTAHNGPEVKEVCTEAEVLVCPLPPHNSSQIQPLDLSLSGVMKHAIARRNRTETVNVQSDHIDQVVGGFMSAASPPNVISTFGRAELF
jgi:hypothetical protein